MEKDFIKAGTRQIDYLALVWLQREKRTQFYLDRSCSMGNDFKQSQNVDLNKLIWIDSNITYTADACQSS